MKLFQRLLVAPAALGLLAPMAATNATEVNLNDISNYSDVESIEFANSFDDKELNDNPVLLAGGEGMTDYDDGGFSSTTSASFSADFLIGAVDGSTVSEAVSAGYGYQIDLSTSFTGEDSFFVSLDAGNGGGSQLGEADLNSGGDTLTVDGIGYQFPVGDKMQVVVGDSIDGSSLYSTACVYGGFTNTLDDCGNASSAFTTTSDASIGASVSYDLGGGWVGALGYVGDGSNSEGLASKAGTDMFGGQIAYTGDSYGFSVTVANVEGSKTSGATTPEYLIDTAYYGLNAYWTPAETGVMPSVSVGTEQGDHGDDETQDTFQWFIGLQWDEAGPGTLGAAVGSAGALKDSDEDLAMYEVFYSYPINDGMTITPALFVKETAGASTDDITGAMIKTSFSF